MRGGLSKLFMILLLVAIGGVVFYRVERSRERHSAYWTDAEAREFQDCMPRSTAVWNTHKEAEDYCLVWEEHQHWMRNHPEVAGRQEDSARFRQCNHDHAAQMNGTRGEFRVAFDECMREAYGLTPQ